MREELEQKLAEKYPFMRQQHSYGEQEADGFIHDLYGAFGCECGDGWYDLLSNLCAELAQAYEAEGIPVDIVVDQVKEKYGTLRFYYHFSDQAPVIQAIDLLGQCTVRIKPTDKEFYKRIDAIASKWEAASETVCEHCGKPGELRTDLGWALTLCDNCHQKHKARRY